MLKEIAQFLENMSDCDLVIGTNLFVGFLPINKADGTAVPVRVRIVLENAGGVPVPDLPDWLDPKAVQIWNRAEDFWKAREDAYCIYTAIHGTAGWTLPSVGGGPTYDVLVINAVAPPAPIGNPEKQDHFVFSTNYYWSISNAP